MEEKTVHLYNYESHCVPISEPKAKDIYLAGTFPVESSSTVWKFTVCN